MSVFRWLNKYLFFLACTSYSCVFPVETSSDVRHIKEHKLIPRTTKNKKDGAEMVFVPAGKFLMGDGSANSPRKEPFLKGYYIYKNLVTVKQYRQFCKETQRNMPPTPDWGWKPTHPIVNVSWNDAMAYCKWAGVTLPTEQEWEKAARGTDGRVYPWGNDWDSNRLWHSKKIDGDANGTHEVGFFIQGPYGLSDMVGNVEQWCLDVYRGPGQFISPDNTPPHSMRGGPGWREVTKEWFQCAHRAGYTVSRDDAGFRCVKHKKM